MIGGTTTQKVLIKVEADTATAARAMATLEKAVASQSSALSKMGKLSADAFSSLGSVAGKANQAFEMFGKSVAFADKGLLAYSKTSTEALAQVTKLRDGASGAMDTIQASMGKALATGLEPMIGALGKMVNLFNDVGALGPAAIGATALAITGNPAIAAILALGAAGGYSDDAAGVIFNARGYAAGKRAQAARGAAGALSAVNNTGNVGIAAMNGAGGGPDPWAGGSSAWERIGRSMGEGMGKFFETKSGGKGGGVDRRDARFALDTWRQDEGGNVSTSRLGAASQQMAADSVARDAYGNPTDLSIKAGNVLFDLYEERTQQWIERTKANAGGAGGPSVLDKVMGPLDEYAAHRAAWEGLSGALTGTYEALVTGSESAGKAMKRLAADGIMGIGKTMLVEGLKESAHAIGSLASYNYPAAAMHGAAAAKYFAGAAVAGVVANSLGGGTGGDAARSAAAAAAKSGGTRPTAPSSYGSPASGGYQGGQNVTIVYGDQFADDSPRNRQRTAQKLVAKALGTSGGTYS